MVYVFQMFFSWDRRSQGTFPAVSQYHSNGLGNLLIKVHLTLRVKGCYSSTAPERLG